MHTCLSLMCTPIPRCRLYDPVGGEHMNVMKVGLQTAHQLVAVSRGYAWECLTPVSASGVVCVCACVRAGVCVCVRASE